MQEKFIKAAAMIKAAENILLVAHQNPDGDAVASLCAFMEYLKSADKRYFAFCNDEPPIQFSFLEHCREINYRLHLGGIKNENFEFDFGGYDLIAVFDCGSVGRTGLKYELENRQPWQKVVEFDHHLKVDDYADIEMRDPFCSSTSELVYDFFTANKIKPNKHIANALLTGIITDTGNFLYPSTSDRTVKAASNLLAFGANLPKIIENTMRNKNLEIMKAWGYILANLRINQKYNFAISVLSLDEVRELGIGEDDLEGIAGFLSSLKEVKGVLFLREKEKGLLKGSLRTSHPDINVAKIAERLGGGGHIKASAFIMHADLQKTELGWRVE